MWIHLSQHKLPLAYIYLITPLKIICTSHNAILAIGRLTLINIYTLLVFIDKNVGTEHLNESMTDWHSDTLFRALLEWYITVQTFKTFWPSKPSDLQNFLTFKTFWPLGGCSESTCTNLYNAIINPWHQCDNHHPNMLKPQCYILAIYILYAYYIYHYQLYVKSRLTINPKNMFILTENRLVKYVRTECLNESMNDWHSDTLFQVCCWKLP